MNNRLGKIEISEEFMKPENLVMLLPLFSVFIPVHIEDKRLSERIVIYTGYSNCFDVINEGDPIPIYDVNIENEKIKEINKR